MKAVVLKCSTGSRFHFGKYAPDDDTALNDSDEIMHSDTLFAALVLTWQQCYGDAQDLVMAFENNKLRISSLFFCLQQENKYVWMLPKPICFNLVQTDDYKAFRSIKYISKKVWETIETPAALENNMLYLCSEKNEFVIVKDEINLKKGEIENIKKHFTTSIKLSETLTLPKVTVRGNESERGIYQLTVTETPDNNRYAEKLQVHYYFLLDDTGLDEAEKTKLKTVLKLLADNGIGAERSTIGRIEDVEIVENWDIEKKDNDASWDASTGCCVSLFSPENKEDSKQMIFFKTIMRGGRRTGKASGDERINPVYLKSVRMLCEGAIVTNAAKGSMKNVSPEKDSNIYIRYGKAFCLPVRKNWLPQ